MVAPHSSVQLHDGQTLQRPVTCPYYVYNLMLQCWTTTADSRATVSDVEQELITMLSGEELATQVCF